MQTKELEEVAQAFELFKAQTATLVKFNLMSENDYYNLPDELADIVEVGMGGSSLKHLLDEIDLKELITQLSEEADAAKGQRKKKLLKRLRLLESMDLAGIKPNSMCLTVLPVIPPDLADGAAGLVAVRTSDMNDLYRRVINRNNRLKKLIELNAPE